MIKRLSYLEHGLKNHVVCGKDLVDVVVLDTKVKHQCEPTSISDREEVIIDPGGMLDMRSKYLSKEINGFKFSVKPEHVGLAGSIWANSKRDLGESSIKVYQDYSCICVDKDTYLKVCEWLVSLADVGLKARMDIYERIGNHPNIAMDPPVAVGDES